MIDILLEKGTAVVVIYLGLWLGFVVFLGFFVRSLVATRWPFAHGVVENSEIIERTETSGSTQTEKTVYKPSVIYHYEVDGVQYKGSRIRFFQGHGTSKSLAEKDVDRFQKGVSVHVYYKKSNPGFSVLLPGFSRGSLLLWFCFVGSIVSITAGL